MSEIPPAPSNPDDPQHPGAVAAPPAEPAADAAPAPAPAAREAAAKLDLNIPIVSEPRARRQAQVAAARSRTPAEKLESAREDGRTSQASLLVMAPVRPGDVDDLKALLQEVANPSDGGDFEVNAIIPFARLRTVHYARILLHAPSPSPDAPIPRFPPPDGVPQASGPAIPPKLLFSTDFDGPLDAHVDELLDVAGPGLDRVFGFCDGWPGHRNRAGVHDFVLLHRVPSNTFYTGTMHRSVDQIHREAELHDAIEGYLDREAGAPGFGTDPVAIRNRVREWVFAQPGLAWARREPGPFPKLLFNPDYLAQAAIGVGIVALAVLAGLLRLVLPTWTAALLATGAVAVVVAGLAFAAWRFLRKLEETDPVIVGCGVKEHTAKLVRTEDRIVQNEMSSVIYIKEPLWFRRPLLKAVLAFINFSARYLSNQGTLAGIPSIHFARWVMVDEGRRLVFFSNFDGSWENYLGDFIDKSHSGLTAVWSNCVGFPRTHGLVGGGATDEQKFKAYSRDSQIPTQVWYSAYRWLSVDNINNNSKVRLGLYGEMTADGAHAWLRRFGGSTNVDNTGAALPASTTASTTPRPAPGPAVEVEDVQGLVARSFNALRHADYVPVYLPDDAAGGRAWVGEMADAVTSGAKRGAVVVKEGHALNLAFTGAGLEKLGMDAGALETFPREFTEGMTTAHRQRTLGDDGDSAPELWAWGAPGRDVHAMLFVFAATPERLGEMVAGENDRAARHGVRLGSPLGSIMLEADKEHFGFHDGIAQPRIAGFRAPDDGESPSPTEGVVPAGEVVLGYANAYGELPDSPSVPDTPGARQVLPVAPADPDAAPGTRPRLDLGRNGSYVVFRQLEQRVQAFWRFLDAQARADAEQRKRLGAKMVGRWPNGAPLELFPDAEPAVFDPKSANDFMYSGDERGDRCPLGSHIRRNNPRDGQQPGPAGSLLVADRHRLLRRGRAYGQPLAPSFDPADILSAEGPDTGRGLQFICFNTDLGRQFEFVQGTWVNSRKFDGLYADPDPVIGPHVDPATAPHPEQVTIFTEQRCPVRHRVHGVPRFVTTVGGAYLFMPGMRALRYLARLD
ncbi:MAG: cytochrome [Gemmatimonadetes bacterium]|nr:cytochrome [Gemmatimonadota bacterium]